MWLTLGLPASATTDDVISPPFLFDAATHLGRAGRTQVERKTRPFGVRPILETQIFYETKFVRNLRNMQTEEKMKNVSRAGIATVLQKLPAERILWKQ